MKIVMQIVDDGVEILTDIEDRDFVNATIVTAAMNILDDYGMTIGQFLCDLDEKHPILSDATFINKVVN